MSDSIITLKTRNHLYSAPIPPYWSMLEPRITSLTVFGSCRDGPDTTPNHRS